jgi:hypothetical protein
MNLRHSLLLVLPAISFIPALLPYFRPNASPPASPQFDNFRQSSLPAPSETPPTAQTFGSVTAGNSAIRGYVFQDVKLNGLWTKGSPGVSAKLSLENSALTLRKTASSRASDGYYQFTGLPSGNYSVHVSQLTLATCNFSSLAVWPAYVDANSTITVSFAVLCGTLTPAPTWPPAPTAPPPTGPPPPTAPAP